MERREFVKNTGLLSTSLLLNSSVFASVSGSVIRGKLKIAVIGCGIRGIQLIDTIQSIEGIELAAVCDVLPFRLDYALKKVDQDTIGYRDYRELLNVKKIDAVVIATPFYTHEAIALSAIDFGKHVYCEMTTTKGISGSRTIVEKLQDSKLIFQAGYQYRSSLLYKHIVEMINSGEIGNVISFDCRWYGKDNWVLPVANPSLERSVNWKMYREYSGGMTSEWSSHQIDFVNWVLGENPKKIVGLGGLDFHKNSKREIYDNTHLLFEYSNGVKASFKCLFGDIPGNYEIKVIGSKGAISIDASSAWIKFYNNNDSASFPSDSTKINKESQQKGKQLRFLHFDADTRAMLDFKESIDEKIQPCSNAISAGHTAIAVQLSLDAMYTGATQYWKESHNLN